MTIWSNVALYFETLRRSNYSHLGLGDIRLTIAQQLEIVDMIKKLELELLKEASNETS
jgi:hypothetical protein